MDKAQKLKNENMKNESDLMTIDSINHNRKFSGSCGIFS